MAGIRGMYGSEPRRPHRRLGGGDGADSVTPFSARMVSTTRGQPPSCCCAWLSAWLIMLFVTVLPVAALAYRWMIAVPTAVSNWLSEATAGMGAAVGVGRRGKVFTAGGVNAGSRWA